jgi:hypothetical protein
MRWKLRYFTFWATQKSTFKLTIHQVDSTENYIQRAHVKTLQVVVYTHRYLPPCSTSTCWCRGVKHHTGRRVKRLSCFCSAGKGSSLHSVHRLYEKRERQDESRCRCYSAPQSRLVHGEAQVFPSTSDVKLEFRPITFQSETKQSMNGSDALLTHSRSGLLDQSGYRISSATLKV